MAYPAAWARLSSDSLARRLDDVVADRLLGEAHVPGDVAVRFAVGNVRQDPTLLLREIGEGTGLLHPARIAETIQHAAGDRRIEQ